ncbi:hypothetical protein BC829DRAFT_378780 [Chytridium lagenaria]|nr:hypothetical protein BC829DRAFT_378780 [Chytridium lagenaria]
MAPRRLIKDPEAALVKLAALRTGVDLSKSTGDVDQAHYYDPNDVFTTGQSILQSHQSHIRSDLERFAIYEQVFIAGLDTGNLDAAKGLLEKIVKKFPVKGSNRSALLTGMMKEAEGDDEGAIVVYKNALKENETYALVQKRLVALLWASGKRHEAVTALAKLVDNYAQDFEGWSQLSSYYMSLCMFQQAAFCMEEMMIYRPNYHLVQIGYADLQRTMGRDDLALKYYCAALENVKDCVRALYGIRIVAGALMKKTGKKGKEEEVDGRLTKLYEEKAKKVKTAGVKVDYGAVVKAWVQAS